jgi:hypothetical protein
MITIPFSSLSQQSDIFFEQKLKDLEERRKGRKGRKEERKRAGN